jgi:hypothetical protein
MRFTQLAIVGLTALTATIGTVVTLPSHLGGATPAQAFIGDWLKQLTPTGLYFEIEGKPFYFGEYADRGNDAIVFKGSKWEVKVNGKVTAHGYGQTPGWVRELARKYFGW